MSLIALSIEKVLKDILGELEKINHKLDDMMQREKCLVECIESLDSPRDCYVKCFKDLLER